MKIAVKPLLLISLCILTSCSNKKEKYDSNGNTIAEYELVNGKISGEYKEFYSDGKLKAIHNYRNGIKIDSSTYYKADKELILIKKYLQKDTIYEKEFKDNVLISEGKYLSNNQLGEWKYYRQNGKLEKIIEYVNLCGHQYTNQGWYFDENGKFDSGKGNYFEIFKLKKTYKKDELIVITIKYKPLYLSSSKFTAYFHPKVDSKFCNLYDVQVNSNIAEKNTFTLPLTFSTVGNKNLRGVIEEIVTKENDSKTHGQRLVYFDIPLKIE